MAYKAMYRTYRPQDFNEVAGQEYITTTFKNALKNDKLAHAYLFSGPRGTGKTSIAKIIANAVNDFSPPDKESILVIFFPPGFAMILIPALNGSSGSSSSSFALPSGDKIPKILLKSLEMLLKTIINFSILM